MKKLLTFKRSNISLNQVNYGWRINHDKVHDKVYQTDLPSFLVMFDSRDSTL